MKNKIKIVLSGLVMSMLLFNACDERELFYAPVDLDAGLELTYLLNNPNQTVVVNTEAATTSFDITVAVWGGVAPQDISIPFEIVSNDLPNGALVPASQNFTVAKGTNLGKITITLNRDLITPGIIFTVNYKMGTPSSGSVNELAAAGVITTFNPGPLAPWVGNYSGAAVSYGSPGDWDEAWGGVTTELNPADPLNSILIKGIAGSALAVVANIDIAAGTITIAHDQNIGDVYGYGDISIYNDASFGDPLVGTVNAETGEIFVDNWGEYFTTGDYAGYGWDVFKVTFTKTAKKSANFAGIPAGKMPKLNK